jgi:MtN3 and saliva related transmembrane protein
MNAGDAMGIDVIGYLAGALTTVAFVPQVVHIVRKRSAHDISWGMFSMFSVGVALWLWYGIRLASLPLIVANGITLTLVLAILALKLHYGSRPRGRPRGNEHKTQERQ